MDKDELINGYFEKTLSERQLKEVEQLRQTDPVFQSDFELQLELQRALKKQERSEIKEMFSQLGDEQKTKPKVFRLNPWLAAASIALLIGIASWFLFLNSGEINTKELYASHFVPYENVVMPIERGEEIKDLKASAFAAYENEEYSNALKLFEKLQTIEKDAYIDFYSAMVLMQLNRVEEAIPLLEGYIEKEGKLKDRATWYLALAYLKINNVGASKKELNKLILSGSFKSKTAKALLSKLD